jgi:hypothetical protein
MNNQLSITLEGVLLDKMEVQNVSPTFTKQDFVLQVETNNGKEVFFDFVKITASKIIPALENIPTGSNVRVFVNIKGNKVEKFPNTSYFTNLNAWKIEQI